MRPIPLLLILAAVVSLAAPAPVRGAAATEQLAACLGDQTNGKERKELVRWIFVAIASHPAIRDIAEVSDTQREQADRGMAGLVMRLLTERCRGETARAMREDGQKSLETAFGSLGELAMGDLMSSPEVETSIEAYARYLDGERLQQAFEEKPADAAKLAN